MLFFFNKYTFLTWQSLALTSRHETNSDCITRTPKIFSGQAKYGLTPYPRSTWKREPVILAGDLNSILQLKDMAGGENASFALQNVVNNIALCDSWEVLRGNTVEFSYITHGSASHIDRCYVSSTLRTKLRTTHLHIVAFSDHKALTVRMNLPISATHRTSSYWQLWTHILLHEVIEEFDNRCEGWTRQRRNYDSWIAWWIELAKPKIWFFCVGRPMKNIVISVWITEYLVDNLK